MQKGEIMKKILIWGAGEFGIKTMRNLARRHIKVSAFIDSNVRLQDKQIDGNVEVWSFEKCKEKYKDQEICVLISAVNAKNIFEIFALLDSLSWDVGLIKPYNFIADKDIDIQDISDDNEILWKRLNGKESNVVPRIEMNIIDGCNLKCKACTHFSSLYEEDAVCSMNEFTESLNDLRRAGKLLRLRLLGGEPFLIDNLPDYLEQARRVFPESDIELVTNGLLIPRMSEQWIHCFERYRVTIVISLYPPTLKIQDKIENVLSKSMIIWKYDGNEILEFGRNLTLKPAQNMFVSSQKCLAVGCTFLRNRRLYKCPFEGLISDFDEFYNLKIEISDSGYEIDHGEDKDLYEHIKRLALEPVEMCRYCSEDLEWIPWEVCAKPELEDWLYKEGKSDC